MLTELRNVDDSINGIVEKNLDVIRKACRLRKTRQLNSELHDFSSNDYLGLSKESSLRKSLIEFLQKDTPLSAASSRLIPGHSEIHTSTEVFLADFFSSPAGLIFNSGYAANTGVLSTLCKNAVVFSDQLNHASIIDGIRLSRSTCHIYQHRDLEALQQLLAEENSTLPKIVVTESVFSMDGDLANLTELQNLCSKFNALLIVDEAHATGIFGATGAGLIEQAGLDRGNVLSIHTFGKALGAYGAYVACSTEIRDYLVNCCREFIFTTALPPHIVWQMQESVRFTRENSELRKRLWQNIQYIDKKCTSTKYTSPILPIVLGSNTAVLEAEETFRSNGFEVAAIRSPSVPEGTERLRICIHADHTVEQLDQLAALIKNATRGL